MFFCQTFWKVVTACQSDPMKFHSIIYWMEKFHYFRGFHSKSSFIICVLKNMSLVFNISYTCQLSFNLAFRIFLSENIFSEKLIRKSCFNIDINRYNLDNTFMCVCVNAYFIQFFVYYNFENGFQFQNHWHPLRIEEKGWRIWI